MTSFTGSTMIFRESPGNIGGESINFATPMFGDTIFSVHVGAARGQASGMGCQGTAIYRFDAGDLRGGLDTIGFDVAGLSSASLIDRHVHARRSRASTRAMLIAGFLMAGTARAANAPVPARA